MTNTAQGPTPAVSMRDISKSFGGIRALDNVDFEVSRGEIHALLGENGAGKSTILKILRGVIAPDAGTIEIDGHQIASGSAEAARRAGIGMIFQEMSLIPTLTVAQNIFLNHELRDRLALIDDRAAERRSQALFDMLGVEVSVEAEAGTLGTGQRQLTEIVKAISQRASILILDEPTSALSGGEVESLFSLLRRLRAEGVAIVYVSHRMDEIMRIADRATILRDGRRVTTAPITELTLEAIVTHIVGRRIGSFDTARGEETERSEVLLELDRVSGVHKPRELSLSLRRGEVIGVAGLLGSGRSSLARLVAGIDPIVSGEMRVRGRSVRPANARESMASGIALIPEDRLRQGVVVDHSVGSNICLPVLDKLSSWSWVSRHRAARLAEEQITRLRIKTESADNDVRTLSGGNQQKVVLAKWLAAEPDILVLDEPTAGIDVGSKLEIIGLVRDLARQGKAIILVSSELSELIAASDRIAVMAGGRIVQVVERNAVRKPGDAADAAEHRLQVLLQEAVQHV